MAAFIRFNPETGEPMTIQVTWSSWLAQHRRTATLFDPWNGRLRPAREVYEDPTGKQTHKALRWDVRHGSTDKFWKDLEQLACGLEDSLDDIDNTALLIAAANGRGPLTLELVRAGANVRAVNANGVSFLHFAAMHEETLHAALATPAQADINATDERGATPLMHAIRLPVTAREDDSPFGHALYDYSKGPGLLERLALLLAHGAAIDHVNCNGRTALMNAAYLGYEPAYELLIKKGARQDLVCHEGKDAQAYRNDGVARRERAEAIAVETPSEQDLIACLSTLPNLLH